MTCGHYGPLKSRVRFVDYPMRLPFEHHPVTEHTRYLLLFITNGGGL
jgi:hypothetical protein